MFPGRIRLTFSEVASEVVLVVTVVDEAEGAAVEVLQEVVGALHEEVEAAQNLVSGEERKL